MDQKVSSEKETFTDPVADEILEQALRRGGSALGKAVREVSRLHPEWRLQVIWNRVRYLKRRGSRNHNGRYNWTAELDEILRDGYRSGPAGAKKAINKVLELRPEWSRNAVWQRAHRLGITSSRESVARPWSEEEERYALMHATVTPIPVIAKRLNRPPASVRSKIREMGYSTTYEGGFAVSRIASLLRVSPHTVRQWLRKGWLGKNWGGRISERSIREFLKKHPDKVRFEMLSPEAQSWLVEEMGFEPKGQMTATQEAEKRQSCGDPKPAAWRHSSKDG